MARLILVVASLAVLASTAHGVVAGAPGGSTISRGAVAVGLVIVALVSFWLGRRFSMTSAVAVANARAEARAASIASAQSRAQQAVFVNVGKTEQVPEIGSWAQYEDGLSDEIGLSEDSGEDLAVEGAGAGGLPSLPASPAVPQEAREAFEYLQEVARARGPLDSQEVPMEERRTSTPSQVPPSL